MANNSRPSVDNTQPHKWYGNPNLAPRQNGMLGRSNVPNELRGGFGDNAAQFVSTGQNEAGQATGFGLSVDDIVNSGSQFGQILKNYLNSNGYNLDNGSDLYFKADTSMQPAAQPVPNTGLTNGQETNSMWYDLYDPNTGQTVGVPLNLVKNKQVFSQPGTQVFDASSVDYSPGFAPAPAPAPAPVSNPGNGTPWGPTASF